MIIAYQVTFDFDKFLRKEYPLRRNKWLSLLKNQMAQERMGDSDGRVIYTTELSDLIDFGQWLLSSPYCPIEVSVSINNEYYFYGPWGDLHRKRPEGLSSDTLCLSQYR